MGGGGACVCAKQRTSDGRHARFVALSCGRADRAPVPPRCQVPHDDNRLLLRNLLMMCMVAGVAGCFGLLMVEARKMIAP